MTPTTRGKLCFRLWGAMAYLEVERIDGERFDMKTHVFSYLVVWASTKVWSTKKGKPILTTVTPKPTWEPYAHITCCERLIFEYKQRTVPPLPRKGLVLPPPPPRSARKRNFRELLTDFAFNSNRTGPKFLPPAAQISMSKQ